MGQQAYKSDEDKEYKEANREFYDAYNALKKTRRVLYRIGDHITKGSQVTVTEYDGSGNLIKTICRVKAENSTDSRRIAAEQLRHELEKEDLCIWQ